MPEPHPATRKEVISFTPGIINKAKVGLAILGRDIDDRLNSLNEPSYYQHTKEAIWYSFAYVAREALHKSGVVCPQPIQDIIDNHGFVSEPEAPIHEL